MIEAEIAAYINAAAIGVTTTGAVPTLYARPLPDSAPDQSVSVVVYDGRADDMVLGGAVIAQHPVFQVMTRSSRDSESAASTLAAAVHAVLQPAAGSGARTFDSVTYRDVRSLNGPPKFLSYDGTGRPRYYCNYIADKDPS